MNIVVDCRAFTKRATGIATYAIDAIRAICSYAPELHLILVSPTSFHESITGLPVDKLDIIIDPVLRKIKVPNLIWYHFYLPKIIRKLRPDIVWSPMSEVPLLPIGKTKKMITVHDVVNKEYKSTMLWKNRWFALPFVNYSIKKADLIWCNSNYTHSKLNLYYPNRKQQDVVIGDSCSTKFRKIQVSIKQKNEIYKKYAIEKGFILFVGTIEPRKNLSFLLHIIPEIYKRTGYKLLIVGAKGWQSSNLSSIINASDYPREAVCFTQYIGSEELIVLYNLANLYISTALNEGFGMPQLEAMACGCPVVSPHNSAMIEVVEKRGLTIKGWDKKNWVNQICGLLEDMKKIEAMKNPDISEYNWQDIIERVRHYIEEKSK
ncbi:glycosyltransferase family 1 protein [Bacteroides sp. Marseille-P3684]|uniref:glycosyltransferase family 4 protein n=1 Tax=Bacteroides sp. Marseille-P3684 TaxID=2086579 RepID=UPI000D0B7642|nr:glycosyltransferase family 1 protein [Bacteroides sp. Marseille-P3684]